MQSRYVEVTTDWWEM